MVDDDFEILDDNMQALKVFMACSRHWTIIQLAKKTRIQGISPQVIESVMNAYKVEDTQQTLDDVQWIETGALEVMNR